MNKYFYYPTFRIQVVCSLIFSFNLYMAYRFLPHFSWWYIPIFLVQVLVMIKVFTPIHEGSHGLISPIKWMNEFLFFLLWPMFPFGPHLFRIVHLIHHAATGEKGVDADQYNHSQKKWGVLLRCSTMVFHCLYYIIKNQIHPSHKLQTRFIRPHKYYFIVIWFYIVGQMSLVYFSFQSSYAISFALSWFFPSLMAIAIVTYLNAFKTHQYCEYENTFQSAHILKVNSLIRWFLCDQNYHFVHHYRPSIPWYRYKKFWESHRHQFISQGVQEIELNILPQNDDIPYGDESKAG